MYAYIVFLASIAAALAHTSNVDMTKCQKKLWQKDGCRDGTHQDLIELFDDRPNVDWDNTDDYYTRLVCACRDKASTVGYSWFALYKYGICWSSPHPIEKVYAGHPKKSGDECLGVVPQDRKVYNSTDGDVCFGGEFNAFFYKIVKEDGALAVPPVDEEEKVAEELAVQCSDKSDVLLLVDTSGSIGEDNFQFLKSFVLEFLNRYDFSSSRLGLITFDHKCYVNVMWTDSAKMSLDKLREHVNNMKYTMGSTLTDNALKCARDKLIHPFRRPGVPVTIFVMTDGVSFNGDVRIPPIVNELRQSPYNCNILSIGIGNDVDDDQLITIAGDASRVFKADNFKNLMDRAAIYLNSIIAKACV